MYIVFVIRNPNNETFTMMIYLDSVGSFFDVENQMIYPAEFNGVTEIPDMECGIPFEEVSIEWIDGLSEENIGEMISVGLDFYTE